MKEAELARATSDYERRVTELEKAAERADIHADTGRFRRTACRTVWCVMSFLNDLRDKRRKFLAGLNANREDIKLDIFKDFYPDKAHFIYELLQNAEDTGASEVSFTLSRESLLFEHEGRPFRRGGHQNHYGYRCRNEVG